MWSLLRALCARECCDIVISSACHLIWPIEFYDGDGDDDTTLMMMTHSPNATDANVQCRKLLTYCAASFCAACGSVMALKSTDSKISVMHGIFITFMVYIRALDCHSPIVSGIWNPFIFRFIFVLFLFYIFTFDGHWIDRAPFSLPRWPN